MRGRGTRSEKVGPDLVRLKASLVRRFPALVDSVLQGVVFPVLAAYQRRLLTDRWMSGGASIPPEATGTIIVTRLPHPPVGAPSLPDRKRLKSPMEDDTGLPVATSVPFDSESEQQRRSDR